MATSYGTIIGHPDYAKLPPEKKQSIAQQYWKDDPLVADAVALTQTAPDDLSSIQQKAFDDRRKISALRIASREPEAAQYAEQIDAGIKEAEDNLSRLSSIYTPEAQNDIDALIEPARNTGWYGSLPLENQLGRVGVGYSPEQYQEIYNSQRDATAQKYGLTTEQLDDVVRHQMDAQEKPVSRDALGRVHIKNDVFIQGLDSVKKNVEDSDLPASVKSQELEGIDDRYKGFQETVVANTLQNHKDYAKEIGLDASKSVEENFKKIGESLNTGTLENEFSSAVQATRQGGAAVLRGLGTVAEAISPEAAGESGLRRTADQLDRRQKIFESQLALSNEFNNDKLSIFGLTPGAIGQGIGSVAESAVIAHATGGLIPRIGGAGALSGYLNSIRGVAPTAAIIGTRTGLQTYDDAIKQGLSEEEATRAGLASGIIEAGTTLAFTAAGAGGIEDIAAGMKKTVGPAVKSAFGAATKDVAKNTLGEVTEESIINALDQALVQTTVQPGMTTEQFLQSVKDTAVATLIAGGPITAASGVATYQQTNEQLRQRANQIAEENLPEVEAAGGDVAQASTPSLAEERATLTEQVAALEGEERLAVEERIAEIDNELPASETAPAAQVEPVVEETIESPAQAEVPTDSLPEGQTAPSDQGGVVTLNEDGQEQDQTQTETPTLEQPVEQLPDAASQEGVVVDETGGAEVQQAPVNEQETQTQSEEEVVSAEITTGEPVVTSPNQEVNLPASQVNETTPNPPTPPGTGVESSEVVSPPTTPPERPNAVTEEPELVGPRKSINTAIRRRFGLNDPTVRVPQTTREAVEAADAELAQNPDAGRELVTSLQDTGRIANAKETALLSHEFTKSVNELERAEKRLQDTSGDDAAKRTRINDYEIALSNFNNLSNLISTNASEASFRLNAQKILRRKDYSYAGMLNHAYAAKNRGASSPTPLTKEEAAEVKKDYERNLTFDEELAAAEQQAYARGRQDAENERLGEAKKRLPKDKKTSAEKIADLNRKAREARQRLNDRFKRRIEGGQAFSGGITEEDVVDVAIIATSYIRAGAVALADFTTRLVKEFGESARPFAERIFAEANAMLNGISKTPEQLVAEMDPSKPINRQSVNSMVRSYLEENIKLSAQDVVTKLQSDLKAKWPDITRNQASDAWTGYGQESTTPQTRSEVQRAATDLRRAALLQRQIDDLKAGKYNKKTRTPKQVSDEVKRLTEERNTLLKSAKVPVPRDPVATAKARIRKQIENLQQAVANNELIPSRTSQTDAELDALRAELKTAQDAYNEAFPEYGPDFDAKSRRIIELQQAIEKNQLIPAKEKTKKQQDERDSMLKELKQLYKEAFPIHGPSLNAKQREILDLQQAISNNQALPLKERKASKLNEDSERLKKLRKEYKELFPEQGTQLTPNQEEDRVVKALDKQIERLEKQEFEAAKKQDFSWYSPEISEKRKRLNDLREARNEIRWQENSAKTTQRAIDVLEDILATGNLPETSKRKPKYTPDQRLKALLDEKNQLQKRVAKLRKERGLEDAQYKAAEKSLRDYERRIRDRDFEQKPRTAAVSERVKEIRAQRDAAQKQFSQMRRENESEAVRESRQIRALERSREDYEQRLRDGNFTREKKDPLDTEAVRAARYKRDKARADFQKRVAELELANYGKWQTFLRRAGATASLLKMIKLAGDLGNFFRNVGPYTIKLAVNPFTWGRLIKLYGRGIKSFLTAQNEYDIYNAYNNHPLIQQYGGAEKLGLKLVNPFDESSASQEAGLTLDFVERLAESQTARNLGVGKLAQLSLAIERANRTWATASRAEMFMQFANLESNRQMSTQEAKNLAQAINIVTGYGGLSQDTKTGQAFEKAVPFLNNTITLSARWAAAKIQYGLGVPIWNTPGYANKARMIRDVYAINFAGRVLLGAVAKAMFIVAKGGEFPDDPEEWKKEFLTNWNPWDSENGGGLKFDGTKISFDSGNDAFLSLLAKSIPYYKDGTWERREVKGGKWVKVEPRNLGNKWTSYFANRMNPVTSSLYRSFIKGQNYDGKPLNLHTTEGAWNLTKEWFQPIIASDIDKIYKNHGMEGVLIFLSAFHGANVRFKPGPKKSAQTDRFNLR